MSSAIAGKTQDKACSGTSKSAKIFPSDRWKCAPKSAKLDLRKQIQTIRERVEGKQP
jgi:hypothetical protein